MPYEIRLRRFPLVLAGFALIAVSVAPTVMGMLRGFRQSDADNARSVVAAGVDLAFHPGFIACGIMGLSLCIVGIVRLATRRRECGAAARN